LDRDIALVSLRLPLAVRPAPVAPPGYTVRPGDRVFTIGCDKGNDPSVQSTQITAVNRYRGKPNYTAAGQPVDGRSGGGLFTADGLLIGICNAADPADNEGLYAGLASIHWQLDQIGQSEIYQRGARKGPADAPRETGIALAAAQGAIAEPAALPQLGPRMPPSQLTAANSDVAVQGRASEPQQFIADDPSPLAVGGEDTEIVFIIRSKRDSQQRSEVYVVDQAPPDLISRITHAARAAGQQRAALAQRRGSAPATSAIAPHPAVGSPSIVRGQSTDY
jgi:hypothetical protein